MAGRGTDIMLGGNPAGLASEILHRKGLNPAEVDKETYAAALAEAKAICDEDHERVVAAGGLHIIGTERHESRRIDNQLRGRAGRQGDPGSSRFYLSLEDDLMKRFASERVAGIMERLGPRRGRRRSSRASSRKTIESAQTPRRGLQLRHPQARRRVRRRHQQAARDDLRRARQGPPQRGPDGDRSARSSTRRSTRSSTSTCRARRRTTGTSTASPPRSARWASSGDGHDRGRALGARRPRGHRASTCASCADAKLEAREAEIGAEDWAIVERLVLLRTIDSLWVEHLTELDDMRRGIGLRGYAQQDPLNEFRKEAFRSTRSCAASSATRSRPRSSASPVVREQAPPRGRCRIRSTLAGAGRRRRRRPGRLPAGGRVGGGAERRRRARPRRPAARAPPAPAPTAREPSTAVAEVARRSGARRRRGGCGRSRRRWRRTAGPRRTPGGRAKIGRNDPCWCGSGHEVQEVPRPLSGRRAGARAGEPGRRRLARPRRRRRSSPRAAPAVAAATPTFRIWRAGHARRAAARGRDRRPRRRPVQRHALGGLRGAPRPRRRSSTRRASRRGSS